MGEVAVLVDAREDVAGGGEVEVESETKREREGWIVKPEGCCDTFEDGCSILVVPPISGAKVVVVLSMVEKRA